MVVGIPAAGVPDVVEEAGALGCGGAVVYGAGFGEVALGRGARAPAARGGRAAFASGVRPERERDRRPALAGGDVGRHAADPRGRARGARVAERQRGGERAGGPARHPLPHGGLVRQLGRGRPGRVDRPRSRATTGVRSIALYLEADGDGALLCEALADCAERGVGVAVLKVGESRAGAAAAAAHTGAVAGDQRVFRALVEEAGAAWAEDVHDLLEIAKALAVPEARTPARVRRRASADPHLFRRRLRARRRRVRAARAAAAAARRGHGGAAARAAAGCGHGRQPARLHGADLGRCRAAQRHHRHGRRRTRRSTSILIFYDQATDAGAAASWAAVREGIRSRAPRCPVP